MHGYETGIIGSLRWWFEVFVRGPRPYGDGLMRVWGWIPEQADVYHDSWNRDKVLDTFYQYLKTNYTLQV